MTQAHSMNAKNEKLYVDLYLTIEIISMRVRINFPENRSNTRVTFFFLLFCLNNITHFRHIFFFSNCLEVFSNVQRHFAFDFRLQNFLNVNYIFQPTSLSFI